MNDLAGPYSAASESGWYAEAERESLILSFKIKWQARSVAVLVGQAVSPAARPWPFVGQPILAAGGLQPASRFRGEFLRLCRTMPATHEAGENTCELRESVSPAVGELGAALRARCLRRPSVQTHFQTLTVRLSSKAMLKCIAIARRYLREPRCGFFNCDWRILIFLRLGLLITKVPLPRYSALTICRPPNGFS